MARTIFIPGHGVIIEDGEEEYFVPGHGVLSEDNADTAVTTIHLTMAPYIPATRS